ncbi:MAG: hypothetical protein ACRC0X_02295 [Brevinema sp.]
MSTNVDITNTCTNHKFNGRKNYVNNSFEVTAVKKLLELIVIFDKAGRLEEVPAEYQEIYNIVQDATTYFT